MLKRDDPDMSHRKRSTNVHFQYKKHLMETIKGGGENGVI